ncbi:group II truncated hemoglobin [Photobacterium sp. DNB23_23_1]|uniref:Group II truncated hemoglobin n=1 Tax=Photobacterium pectinilyticum TaxID=2906793 RepID=A0ABT1MXR9_9GAMM|nr:group II truncated hemoglobin [Photobacterium sp. ZSDE20]MCQ1057290.1 group II truncated hemoglobin [Photobacterium sp. ZSDE20]MDD1821749.1 group II truncated hemoglobin [Photobacterium sp. ZSDE20]
MKPYRPNDYTVQVKTAPDYTVAENTFNAAGGEEGIRTLVESFYRHMDTLPQAKKVRQMHGDDLAESIDKLTTFLVGWLGGPSRYEEKFGMMNLPGAHRHLAIGVAEKEIWLHCMQKALDEQGYDELFIRHIMVQLSFPAEMCRNRN